MLNKNLKIPSAIEFAKSLRSISTDWQNKTPNQKWCYIYAVGKIASKPVGVPLFEEDQTIHWYSYCSYAVVGTYFALSMYTAYYYATHGETERWLPSTCLLGIIFCYIPFVWSTLSKNRDKYHSLISFAGHYIYPNNHEHTEHNRICSKQMDLTAKSLIIRIVLLVISASCAVYGPIYVYFFHGIKTTTIEVKIPSVEENPDIEYTINMILQFTVYVHGSFLYFGIEFAMAILGDIVRVSPKLIKNRINKLIKMYEGQKISEVKLRFAFKDIKKQMLDYENFVIFLQDFLYWRTLVTPILFTYSIAMAIFCQYTMDFVAGYGMAMMSWVQFYFLCETGQSIENNGLDLYDSEWYHLPCALQRDLMYLIKQRQNRVTLNMGPFAVINRDLFKIITNRIYTFIMYLLNFSA